MTIINALIAAQFFLENQVYIIIIMLFGIVSSIGIRFYLAHKSNGMKPLKTALYKYDKAGNLVDSPVGKPYALVQKLWGNPDETRDDGQILWRHWVIKYDFAPYADDINQFVLGFDKANDVCVREFSVV